MNRIKIKKDMPVQKGNSKVYMDLEVPYETLAVLEDLSQEEAKEHGVEKEWIELKTPKPIAAPVAKKKVSKKKAGKMSKS